MLAEIRSIRAEIEIVKIADLDIDFLEALTNNAIYCLNKLQTKAATSSIGNTRKLVNEIMTDLLETLNKEVRWAKEELSNEDQHAAQEYYKKAKKQIIESIDQLL